MAELNIRDKVRSLAIQKELRVQLLFPNIERSQLR